MVPSVWYGGYGDMRSPSVHTRLLAAEHMKPNQPHCYGKMYVISNQNPHSHVIIPAITWLVWLSLWWFLQCMKKSCIDCTMHGNFKNIPKFSHSHISESQCWNLEIIIDKGFLGYLNYMKQLLLFLTQLNRIRIWNTVVVVVSFISNRIQQRNNTRKKKTLCTYP